MLTYGSMNVIIFIYFLILFHNFENYSKLKFYMAENYKVDNVDLKILEILMQDAKSPIRKWRRKHSFREVQFMYG